jgi:hypothetical protein
MDLNALLSSPPNIVDPNSMAQTMGFLRSFGASFVFAAATYALYSRSYNDDEPVDGSLARALLVLIPALTVIFWLIKLSFALSVGLVGSMSFIRFRTPIRRIEDAAFLVVGIGVAITSALEAYVIGAALLSGIFLFNVVSRWVLARGKVKSHFAVVTFHSNRVNSVESVLASLDAKKMNPHLLSARSYDGKSSFVFSVMNADASGVDGIKQTLTQFDQDAQMHVFYPNERISS